MIAVRSGPALLAAGGLALAAGVAGCGPSDSSAASGTPTRTSSVAAATESSPTATTSKASPSSPTTTLPPLSPYEKEPQVVAVRAFAVQYAKAVNAKNVSYAPFIATLTTPASEAKYHASLFGTDIKKGLHYPGPVPLTPVRVSGNDVYVCMWGSGFATNPKTGVAAEAKQIYPTHFYVKKVGDGYKVSTWAQDPSVKCGDAKVVGRAW